MAALTSQQKRLIVQRLACFHSPTEVQEELKKLYQGLVVPLPTIMRYDPTTAQGGKDLAKEWRELFEETRARFVEDTSRIAVAHRSYRLQRLQRMLDNTANAKNPKLVLEVLAAAREEMKRLEVSGIFDLDGCTDEQLERIANGEDPLRVLARSRAGEA